MSSTPRRIPPVQHRGEVRRSRILESASQAFMRHGYAGVSVDALVAGAGGSKASIYRYFGSKAGLFMAVVEYLCDCFLHNLDAIDIADGPLRRRLQAILRELVAVVASPAHVAFYRMVVEGEAHVPGAGRAWYEHGPQVWYAKLRRMLHDRAGADGRPVPPLAAEFLFDALFARLTTQTVMLGQDAPGADHEAVIAALVELVLGPDGTA